MTAKSQKKFWIVLTITSLLAMHGPAASAAAIAKAISPPQSLSTNALAIFPSGTQSYTNPGIAYSSSISNGGVKNFYINNGGSRTVSRFSFTVTLPNASNVSFFKRCNLGVAFTGPNTCASGSPTTISMTPGVEVTLVLSLVQGTFYQFKIIQNKSGTITVNSRVSSAFIVATTSNS